MTPPEDVGPQGTRRERASYSDTAARVIRSAAMSELSPITTPQRQILADSVYEAIKELLLEHHIGPGARISIDQLAGQLDVSPTPVREALARLEAEGLAVKEPLRGYRATPLLDRSAFEQLYEVRLLLEPYAARKAAAVLTAEGLATLEQATTEMEEAIRAQGQIRVFAAADARFHDAIAAAAANDLLHDTLVRLRSHLHLYRLYFHIGIADETVPEHREIIAALRSRAAARAEAAMAQHIERSRDRQRQGLAALGAADLNPEFRTR
jgi:DNA-binding GntR family transcriptional regulator